MQALPKGGAFFVGRLALFVRKLALSGSHSFASSPKVGALGSPRKLYLYAKASPFGRGVTAGDGEGEDAKNKTLSVKALRLCQLPPPRGSWRAAPERVYPARQKSMGLRLFCKLFVNPIDKAGGQEYIFSSRADRVLKTKRTAPQEVCKTMKKNIDTINARLCRRRARSC